MLLQESTKCKKSTKTLQQPFKVLLELNYPAVWQHIISSHLTFPQNPVQLWRHEERSVWSPIIPLQVVAWWTNE